MAKWRGPDHRRFQRHRGRTGQTVRGRAATTWFWWPAAAALWKNWRPSLQARHGVEARPLTADLADPAAPAAIFDALRDTPPDILINNAGFGLSGRLHRDRLGQPKPASSRSTSLALAHLTKLFLPGDAPPRLGPHSQCRFHCRLVPGPFMAVYLCQQGVCVSFSEALAKRVQGTGVTVTALCPGATCTGFARCGPGR